jgi:hypothetical protein
MSYNLDTFVATSKELGRLVEYPDTIEYTEEELYDTLPNTFAAQFTHDAVNEQADPVFVYELKGKPVAFYDCELLTGYIYVA